MDASLEIREQLRQRIECGELVEGDQIPSELELARTFQVSRAQAREALVGLEHEGYILRYQGRGSFVAPAGHRVTRLGIKGFRVVAMSCNRLSSHYKRTVIDAFSGTLYSKGFQALTYFLDPSSDSERSFLQGIRSGGVEGLALWLRDRSPGSLRALEAFRETRFPFVLCDRFAPEMETDFVGSDNERIGFELTKGLIAQGHTRVGFVSRWMGNTPNECRLDGYRRALLEAGLPWDEALTGSFDEPNVTPESVIKGIMAFREQPTALFCSDDRVLLKAIEVVQTLGYRLPDDVAFATVDDDRNVMGLGIPVLAARQDGPEIGRQTAELLLARMADPQRPIERRIVNAEIAWCVEEGNQSVVVHG